MSYRVLCDGTDNEAWLRARKEAGIGASEAAAILGDTSWGSPYSVWSEKLNPEVVDIENQRMKWGKRLEPVILASVAADFSEYGEVIPTEGLLQSVEYPHLLATLDAALASPKYGTVPLEAKAVDSIQKKEWTDWQGELAVPPKYTVQVRQQAFVTGAPGGYVAVLFGGNDLHLIWVPQDENFVQRHLIGTLGDFWNVNVLQRVRPDPILGDDLSAIWPADESAPPVLADDTFLEQLEAWREVKVYKKTVEAQEEALKHYFHVYAETGTVIVDTAGRTVMTLRERKGRRTVSVNAHDTHHPKCDFCVTRSSSFRVPVAENHKEPHHDHPET